MSRLWLTFRESAARALQGHQQARTDALTGLGNYRRLQEDLALAVLAAADGAPYALALVDLDGFKSYNDAFGHPAGDRLLVRIAAHLRERLGDDGAAYRIGGDEFCVLLGSDAPDAECAVATLLSALREDAAAFPVRGSAGIVRIPADAATADAALALADRRMYDVKGGVRRSAAVQARDALVHVLAEFDVSLPGHGDAVASLSVAVAEVLGLDAEIVERVRHTACLHDVGKVGVPRSILRKPGPLEPHEWACLRQHTLIGERVLAAAPALAAVAPLVRATHERYDGGGYPDGLAGDAIPIEARIVAACDAYDAMVAERPYRAPRSRAGALAELRSCAGTQFDPSVVACLTAVLGGDARSAA
jgi:diguanylate cyclase (GGDEF)-like protein